MFGALGIPYPKTRRFIASLTNDDGEFPSSDVSGMLSSCERLASTDRPIFDPFRIFSNDDTSMFYLQFFVRSSSSAKLLSWPVRILSYPFANSLPQYVFDGFKNAANETRIIISNFSYFLVEHTVEFEMRVDITLEDMSANVMSIDVANGFSQANLRVALNYQLPAAKRVHKTLFIFLIIIVSLVALALVVCLVVWMRKKNNSESDEKDKAGKSKKRG